MSVQSSVVPDLQSLWRLFRPAPADLPQYVPVESSAVPEPYHSLLVHDHHMTVTLERRHGGPVHLNALTVRRDGDSYARKLTLTLAGSDKAVLFGVMRIDLRRLGPAVRQEVVAGKTPLGRILIEHDVLRRIEFHRCLKFTGGAEIEKYVGVPTYGRLATIFCNGRPAVELLEIVAKEA